MEFPLNISPKPLPEAASSPDLRASPAASELKEVDESSSDTEAAFGMLDMPLLQSAAKALLSLLAHR